MLDSLQNAPRQPRIALDGALWEKTRGKTGKARKGARIG